MLQHFTDIVKSFLGASKPDKTVPTENINRAIVANGVTPVVFINDDNISTDQASGIIKLLFQELKSIHPDAVMLSACHACDVALSDKPALLHWSDAREINNNRAVRSIIEQRAKAGAVTVVFCRVVYDANKKIISTAKVPYFMNGASNVYTIAAGTGSVAYIKSITDYNMSRIIATK